MEEDYMPMTPGGIYNCRVNLARLKTPDDSGKDCVSYEVTVRVHRASEKKEVAAIAEAWETAKDGMWLPRYFMDKGENNVFDGKPKDAVLPKGLPAMTRDEFGADKELAGF